MFLALFKQKPGGDVEEISTQEYARQPIEFDSGGHNTAQIAFPAALSDWGRLDIVRVLSDLKGGTTALSGAINPPCLCYTGDNIIIPVGGLSISDCGLTTPNQQETSEQTPYQLSTADDLTPGNAVYIRSDGRLALACASLTSTEANAVGLAISQSPAGTPAIYSSDGFVTRQDWVVVIGSTYLEVGKDYFLSQEPGKLTTEVPISGFSLKIGKAVYPDTLDIELNQLIELS
ncbi:MAG: hypothetical protein BWK78_00390 [Thiotrichaceae bacterium IS1]|nr:MAG: hypothetical protein BWK78_00390 [Thiotrichaceae bacterium IS1]